MKRGRVARCGVLVVALLLIVAGCSDSDSDDSGSSGSTKSLSLTSIGWVLNDSTDLGVPHKNVAVTAEFTANRISGNSGCNSYNAAIEVTGTDLTIGPDIAGTKVACDPGPTAVEAAYLERLPEVESYEIDGNTLTLSGAGDHALLVYSASAGRDAISGDWSAINYYTGTVVQSVLAGSPPTARFDRGQITGDASCNNYSGPYELTDTSISLGPFSSTLMACADPARQTQEQQYLAALELAKTFRVTGDRLELRRADGGIAVMFERGLTSG